MSSEVSATRLQLADWVALACAALAPLFYLTAGMDRSVWLDEANSVLIALQSPSGLLDALSRDGNPPFYYFLLKLSMAFFGDTEVAIRMPSFLAYVCGIGAIYRLGLYLFDRHVALLACAFFAMSPVAGRQAQNARMYTLLALLTILSTWIFLKIAWAERRTLQLIVLHGAVAALGLLTHYWFAFVLVGQAAWILGTWSRWRLRDVVLLFVVDTLPFTVLWLRTFLLQLHNASASWQQPPRWTDLPKSVIMHFWIYNHGLLVFCLLLGIIAVMIMRRHGIQALRLSEKTVFLLVALCCALGVPFAVSYVKPIFFANRYTIIGLPFLAILAGLAISKLHWTARVVLLSLVCVNCGWTFHKLVVLSSTTGQFGMLDSVPLGDRAGAAHIHQRLRKGDTVVYTNLSRASISYYLKRLGWSESISEISYPAEFATHMGWLDSRREYIQEPMIQDEARQLTARLSQLPHGSRIFMLRGPMPRLGLAYASQGQKLADFLTDHLDKSLNLISTKRFVGSYFSEVREYSPP